MTLTRWQKPEMSLWNELSPFRRLSSLRDELDRFFESPLNAFGQGNQGLLNGWMPALDLFEDNDHVTVKAELPGMRKEDIDINYHDGILTLSGERKEEQEYREAETYRSERFLGKFHRSISLPSPVDVEKVKATYKDGILTVVLPKTEESKPRQIQVDVK